MPLYVYRCPSGHETELMQKIGDNAPETCPVCGTSELERVLFPAAIHFKGPGFHNTDNPAGRRGRRHVSSN